MDSQHHFRQYVGILCTSVLLAGGSCQGPASSGNEATDHADTVPRGTAVSVAVTSCYLHTHERDSVHLRLTVANDTVSGALHFNNYQIDGSRGTVRGRFHGDTLFVIYDFHAEGTHNLTEEAFLKQGADLIRGVGNHEEAGGTYRFADRRTIDFSAGQTFQRVPCE